MGNKLFVAAGRFENEHLNSGTGAHFRKPNFKRLMQFQNWAKSYFARPNTGSVQARA